MDMTPNYFKEWEFRIGKCIINILYVKDAEASKYHTVFPEISFRRKLKGCTEAPFVLVLKIKSSKRKIYVEFQHEDDVKEYLDYHLGSTSDGNQTCQNCGSYHSGKSLCESFNICVTKYGTCDCWEECLFSSDCE